MTTPRILEHATSHRNGFLCSLACYLIFMIGLMSSHAWAQDPPAASLSADAALTAHLTSILENQAKHWNQGDLIQFMSAYWKNDQLTFSSRGKTTRGWQATLDNYRKSYPDQKTMGKLTFSEIEVFPLSPESALSLGRWRLDRDKPIGGNYSLVWRKIDGQWLIVHDHSSSDEPSKPQP